MIYTYQYGTIDSETIWGSNGVNDGLMGFDGEDWLMGRGGSDWLQGGDGGDYLDGGSGFDIADYKDSDAGVIVNLATEFAAGGHAEGDWLFSIENLWGSYYDDALTGDDTENELRGFDGDDGLKGGGGADVLMGGNDNDTLDGGTGADNLYGGWGDDTYYVDNALDWVMESAGQGTDTVRTSVSWALTVGFERLETTNAFGTAAINLAGNASANVIIGNNGDNLISGGGGVDQMSGRGGNDTYYVDNSSDVVTESGGQGMDTVRTSVSWSLTAGADVETLATTDDNGVAAINLTGNSSGNTVIGNNGNNVINGRNGDDELIGRGGFDYFVFDTQLDAANNVDVLSDFNVAFDSILLENLVFTSLGLGNISAGEFVIGPAAQDANDRIIYNSATGALLYDSDGSGATAAVQFAAVGAGLALTSLDFFVV